MDLVQGGRQFGRFHGDVHQPGVTVARWVFAAQHHLLAHLLQNGELHLQELDGAALDRQLRAGDDAGGDEAHRLDRVLRDVVLDILVDLLDALDAQGGGSDTLHADPQLA